MAHSSWSGRYAGDIAALTSEASRTGALALATLDQLAGLNAQSDVLMRAAAKNIERIRATHRARTGATTDALRHVARALGERGADPARLFEPAADYLRDAAERSILTLDALRERGDVFLDHEAAGCPPVLAYDYEVVLDGADLPHPCNYQLLRIVPPEGVTVLAFKRPYIIIDPRAGHGGGIGGFKYGSQVGVALADGHPVYFVSFKRDPVPGQTLADVTRAEAEFVREVVRRHPDSPKPAVAGNCQGGWATLVLAAAHPGLTGPLVLNGAPVATWAGTVGDNPMRYNAGVLGGVSQTMFLSDLGGGIFDGAHLVMNFEQLNPSRNYFSRYYELFADPLGARRRFIEFERWWGGFFLLNAEEIRWIVAELFVGNKLTKNIAQLEPGRPLDIKRIQAPIIVFTSRGDNITPPQQALNWIVDTYADEEEIRVRGQRIIYIVHQAIGHLGIFVSSKIARREHTEVASTMKTIEALAPGLYEMKIDAVEGEGARESFLVSFAARTMADLAALDDGRDDEVGFAAVARASELQGELYDTLVRPLVRAMVAPAAAQAMRAVHPLRLQRAAFASHNPMMLPVRAAADKLKAEHRPARADNPFLMLERIGAGLIEQWLDLARDVRDMAYELTFFALWGSPWARTFGERHALARTLKSRAELRALPEVKSALLHVASGGFVEAVARMLILIAGSRGNVRRDRLERASRVLTQDAPLNALTMEERSKIIHEQTLIVTFGGEAALDTLPQLLPSREERQRAAHTVQYIVGPLAEMEPQTLAMLQRLRAILELPPASGDVTDDPLASPDRSPLAPRAAE